MAKSFTNLKLGIFVLCGLLFLIILLYLIGKNKNMFGRNYELIARFHNVQGLVAGNNVRFSGIQAGTVKKIKIVNDTVMDIYLTIDVKMKNIIRKNAIASIGTEGLVGNKVLNISPSKQPAGFAEEGDILVSKNAVDTDQMLETLSNTNNDIAAIASELKSTVQRINQSQNLWKLLNDETIPSELKKSLTNINHATAKASNMASTLDEIVTDIKKGKGSAGSILRDTTLSANLNNAVLKIKAVGDQMNNVAIEMNRLVAGINKDINDGNGTVHAMLKDSGIVSKLNASLDNIQKGTDGFNQNMEALKHNFLLRGYFKKLEKQKTKQ